MKRTVLLGLLGLVSLSAQAGEVVPGLRVGAALSFGEFQGTDVPDPALGNKFIDDNAIGFKLYGQYQFNKWFGVEGAYHYSGDFEDTSKSEALPGKLKLSLSGFSAQGLVYVPMPSDDVRAYVKAGYYDFGDELSLGNTSLSTSSERGLVFGAGASIDVSEHLGIRADLDWFDANAGDLFAVNLGVEYHFGGQKP